MAFVRPAVGCVYEVECSGGELHARAAIEAFVRPGLCSGGDGIARIGVALRAEDGGCWWHTSFAGPHDYFPPNGVYPAPDRRTPRRSLHISAVLDSRTPYEIVVMGRGRFKGRTKYLGLETDLSLTEAGDLDIAVECCGGAPSEDSPSLDGFEVAWSRPLHGLLWRWIPDPFRASPYAMDALQFVDGGESMSLWAGLDVSPMRIRPRER